MSQSIEIYEKELEQEFGSGSQREMYLLAIIRALKSEAEVRELKSLVDALAAQAEVMRGAMTNAVNVIDLIPEGQAAAVYQMEAVLRSSPEQDLAAHDAQVSAKAVSEFISWATVNVDPEFAEWQDFADKYAAELTGKTDISQLLESHDGYPLIAHLVRQIAFSQKAFGPGLRTGGILDHIAKELKEVAEKPHDLSEWIDVAMLALDGAWRHAIRDGVSDEEIAEQVVDTLQAKLVKNEKRDWPDWRLLGEDKAIEHKRDQEAGAA
ncbi:DUF550 domain-containing protein [Rheinheimera sp. MM224]|uniref:DUF550 domain-containing protein n=1 Tax=Rheinheimera sp. MM224 TaxID=3019969 RepID=UPI0021F863A3|nr:DUF550 domain-containing protein [Rheinheimera sp. MM224]CAI3795687.1 hypothetical protein JAMGFMIE_01380 [Rheinheimera sp. MM224]CAI3795847.1 hypothetical protein JAMGFMIE_01420 [Rheinheimera sp. MM224]